MSNPFRYLYDWLYWHIIKNARSIAVRDQDIVLDKECYWKINLHSGTIHSGKCKNVDIYNLSLYEGAFYRDSNNINIYGTISMGNGKFFGAGKGYTISR